MQAKTYGLNPRGNNGQLEALKQGHNMMKNAVWEDSHRAWNWEMDEATPQGHFQASNSLITFIMFCMLVMFLDYNFNQWQKIVKILLKST